MRPGEKSTRRDLQGRLTQCQARNEVLEHLIEKVEKLLDQCHPRHPQPETCPACEYLGRVEANGR